MYICYSRDYSRAQEYTFRGAILRGCPLKDRYGVDIDSYRVMHTWRETMSARPSGKGWKQTPLPRCSQCLWGRPTSLARCTQNYGTCTEYVCTALHGWQSNIVPHGEVSSQRGRRISCFIFISKQGSATSSLPSDLAE